MCGFDTDCNANSIGTILGVFGGLGGVPQRYRDPIRDTVILSGISGCLNMVDLPSLAYELTETACVLSGQSNPSKRGDLLFDFELPGSTHGLRLSERASHSLRSVRGQAWQGERCLELMIDGKRPGPADLYFTSCFIRSDLEDERYEPVFSPRVYPGQTVSCMMRAKHIAPAEVTIVPFVTLAMSGKRIDLEPVKLQSGTGKEEKEQDAWQMILFTVPDAGGDQIHELGWRFFLKPDEDPWAMSLIYIDMVKVSGTMDYTVDFALQREEFGQITPFSFNDCTGELVTVQAEKCLCLTMPDEPTACGCQAFTGKYYQRETHVSAKVKIGKGESALLLLRGQGTRRYYALGISGKNRTVILRYDGGEVTELAAGEYTEPSAGDVLLEASAAETHLTLSINGVEILSAEDDRFSYGMTGLGMCGPGSILVSGVHISGSS